MQWKKRVLLLTSLGLLSACLQADQLKSLVVEFPESETAKIQIKSEQQQFSYSVPSKMLTQPNLLAEQLTDLPDELKAEVYELLAAVEPPPSSPLSQELDTSMAALEGFLGGIGVEVTELQQGLSQQGDSYHSELKDQMGALAEEAKRVAELAGQQASGVVGQMKQHYVAHFVKLIEQDKLSDEQVKLLEQALIERHRRQQDKE